MREIRTLRRFGHCRLFGVFLLFLLTGPAAAFGDGAKVFHDAAGAAFAHYRQAMFYLRRGAPDVAAIELDEFNAKWAAVEQQFAGAPPGPYRNEGAWRETINEISAHAKTGASLAAAGDAKEARKVLASLRGALGEMRRRNGIYLFADCIADANTAFHKLFYFRRNPPDFSKPDQVKTLKSALDRSIKAYKKCRDTAPEAVAGDPQFQRLMKDSLFYLDRMWVAIDEKNQLAVVNILRRVVSSDDILWLQFG